MTVKEFEEKSKILRKEVFDESHFKQPSIYCLERAGNQLLDIVKILKSKNTVFDPKLQSLKKDLDIFLADLGGELQHDYDRNNKRYKGKWLFESKKIDGLVFQLKHYLQEKKTK
jgi:hypothetical protein